jgi:ABC-type amino acid transport substrate-binding protein
MLALIAECLTVGSAMRRAVFLASPRATLIALVALLLVALSPADGLAEWGVETRPLRVGVFDAPPFFIKNEEGDWEGLSVELWDSIARRQGWAYELREYDGLALLLKGIQAGEVDVTPGLASSVAYEVAMDLSHSYYPSGSGIAVPVAGSGFRWFGIVEQLTSWQFLRVIALLLLSMADRRRDRVAVRAASQPRHVR